MRFNYYPKEDHLGSFGFNSNDVELPFKYQAHLFPGGRGATKIEIKLENDMEKHAFARKIAWLSRNVAAIT